MIEPPPTVVKTFTQIWLDWFGSLYRFVLNKSGSVGTMSALLTANPESNITLNGFHTAGDGGGGTFYYDSTQDRANHNGITIIDPSNAADLATWDASAKTTWFTASTGSGCWMRVYSGSINVKWAGAKGDGVGDDTKSIQAILDSFDDIYLPKSDYLVSATLTRRTGNLFLYGAGQNATRIMRTTNYGDTLDIASATPTTNRLANINIKGLTLRMDAEMTSGGHLVISDIIHGSIEDLHLWNGFVSMSLSGLQQTVINNTRIDTGTYYTTGIETGTKFVDIKDAQNTANETGELFFSNFNWTWTGNANIEVGVDVQAGDGIWFSNGHVFGAEVECYIRPETASTQLAGVMFDNVWFDGSTTKNLVFDRNSTSYKDFKFNNCRFTAATTRSIECTSNATSLREVQFSNCDIGFNTVEGMRWNQGDDILFDGCNIMDSNLDSGANVDSVVLGTGIGNVSFVGGKIGTTLLADQIANGIELQDATVELIVSGVKFRNCEDEVNMSGHMADGSKIVDCTTDRANAHNIASASTIEVPGFTDMVELTGATATVATIQWGWHGRTITLRAVSNQQNFATSGNIITNTGATVNVATGDAITLRYNDVSSKWIQSV